MTDGEILDWLEREFWSTNPRFGYGSLSGNLDLADSESLRAAVEKAAAVDIEIEPATHE